VLEDAGLLLGEDDHLPGPFGEALKHCKCLSVGNNGAHDSRPLSLLDRHLRRSDEVEKWVSDPWAESTNGLPCHLRLNGGLNAVRGARY
jgi:hypothetical protein